MKSERPMPLFDSREINDVEVTQEEFKQLRLLCDQYEAGVLRDREFADACEATVRRGSFSPLMRWRTNRLIVVKDLK